MVSILLLGISLGYHELLDEIESKIWIVKYVFRTDVQILKFDSKRSCVNSLRDDYSTALIFAGL